MSMGRRPAVRQQDLWVPVTDLPRSAGHVFYEKLNQLLAEADFDRYVESLCQPHYAAGVGRSSIPPGVYFRMLLVGYCDSLDTRRPTGRRSDHSLLSLAFLG